LWAPGGRIFGLWKMIEAKQAETGMAAEEIFEHVGTNLASWRCEADKLVFA
jgi:hypothetical protein